MVGFCYVRGTVMTNILCAFSLVLFGVCTQAAETQSGGWFSGWTRPAPTDAQRARYARVQDYTQAYTPKQTGYWATFQNWWNQKRGITPRQLAREARLADYERAYGQQRQPRLRSRYDELTEAYRKNALHDYLYAMKEREKAQAIEQEAAFEAVKAGDRTGMLFRTPERVEKAPFVPERIKQRYREAYEDWQEKNQKLKGLEQQERGREQEYERYLPWYHKIKF